MLLSKFSPPSSISFRPNRLQPRKPTNIAQIHSYSPHLSRLTLNSAFLRLSPNRPVLRLTPIRAEKDDDYPLSEADAKGWRFPPMEKKPRWYWRILSCVFYIMPLHHTWVFAETAYNVHPFLEEIEYITYPFLSALGEMPRFFMIMYFLGAYLFVVRRKEWPHFLRFHVILGLLIEIAIQIMGFVWKRIPLAVYWGKIGAYFWTWYCFSHLLSVIECIRCAICGMYADVPGFSDAAYIQIPYE